MRFSQSHIAAHSIIGAWMLNLLLCNLVIAQHSDALIQDVDGRVAVGSANFDIFVNEIGPRTFQAEFGSAPSGFDCDGMHPFCIELPGFNTVDGSNPSLSCPNCPPGVSPEELPPLTDVEWDFVPIKVDGFVSNLLYWDGSDSAATPGFITSEDVQFGPKPGANYELALEGQTATIAADGATTLVPGNVIRRTNAGGTIHEHRPFELVDGDGDPNSDPVDGIYLMSMRVRVDGLDRSKPAYFVFGTLFPTVDQLDAAFAWVEAHEQDLAPDFDADFDGDLDVDGIDFLTWQRGVMLGGAAAMQTVGDADFNNSIDAADLAIWEQQFGSSVATFAGAVSTPLVGVGAVPVPSSMVLISAAGLSVLSFHTRRSNRAGPP